MTAPVPHDVQADGYCNTCQTVPCQLRHQVRQPKAGAPVGQLDRLELLLHRIARAVGVNPDAVEEKPV